MPAGWVAAAIGGSALLGNNSANRAAADSAEAASQQNQYQNRALDYQIDAERLPRQFREGALTRQAGILGLEGGEGTQQQFIDQAMQSPLYKNLLDRGEESILRNASATGGFRSGNTQDNLARSSQDALISVYDRQMSSLNRMSGLPDNTNAIANTYQGMGTAARDAGIAQANIRQQQNQNNMNTLNNAANLGAMYYSDIRAKDNIKYVGRFNGFKFYEWTWNKLGEKLGLSGKGRGVMAHEIHKTNPEYVKVEDGILMVDYSKILPEAV